MSNDDRLRRHLREMADRTPIADLTVAAVVKKANRRTAVRRGTAVAALAVLIAGVGAVGIGLNRSGDGNEVATGSEDLVADGTGAVVGQDDAVGGDEGLTTADGADPRPFPATPPVGGGEVGSSFIASDFAGGPLWLVPWRDGFLEIGTIYEEPALPAADSEVAANFPPEVLEAIAAAGATNLTEAMDALREAGLLDVATEIVMEQGLLDAISGPGTTTLVARISSDGLNWTDISLGLPDEYGQILDVRSDGTHLLIIREEPGAEGLSAGVKVFFTPDLDLWFGLGIGTVVEGDPEHVQRSDHLSGAALSADGWLVTVDSSAFVDLVGLLPEDVQLQLDNGELDWEITPGGINLQTWDAGADSPTAVRVVAWSELGSDYDDYAPYIEGDGLPTRAVWHGTWHERPRQLVTGKATLPDESNCCRIVGTDAGFLAYSGGGFYLAGNLDGTEAPIMAFSTDGQSWAPRSVPEGWASIDGIHAVESGVVLRTVGPDGQELWRADADGSNLQRVEIPALPDNTWIWFDNAGSRGVAGVVDVTDYDIDFEPSSAPDYAVTIEHDGFSIEVHVRGDGFVDTVIVELATGDVVLDVSRNLSRSSVAALPLPSANGVAFVDDDGELVLEVPSELFDDALAAAEGEAGAPTGGGGLVEPAGGFPVPDLWIVASADAISWLVEDLDDYHGQSYLYSRAAVNGDIVALDYSGDWLTFDLP